MRKHLNDIGKCGAFALIASAISLLGSACGEVSIDLPALTSEQANAAVAQIRSICIDLNADIPWQDSDEVTETLQDLFTRLGLETLTPEQSCEMDFRLNISGGSGGLELVGYVEDGIVVATEVLEPWAHTEGEVSLELAGYLPLTLAIDNRGKAESQVDFFPQVLDHIAVIWGSETYRHAIHVPALSAIARDALIAMGDEGVRILGQLYLEAEPSSMYELWMAFQMLGPEATEAIPYMIDAIGDGKRRLNEPAGLLSFITGEDFGGDADAWLTWWQSQ